jgi:hypothetical protein
LRRVGFYEALPKPDKHLSAHPSTPRQHPFRVKASPIPLRSPSAARPRLLALAVGSGLRPAAALPVTLVGRDAHGYYGLSAPLLPLVTSRPTLIGSQPEVPALLMSQVLCCRRYPLDPFTWRTTLCGIPTGSRVCPSFACFILWAGTWWKPASGPMGRALARVSQGADLPAMQAITRQGDHFPQVETRFVRTHRATSEPNPASWRPASRLTGIYWGQLFHARVASL